MRCSRFYLSLQGSGTERCTEKFLDRIERADGCKNVILYGGKTGKNRGSESEKSKIANLREMKEEKNHDIDSEGSIIAILLEMKAGRKRDSTGAGSKASS